MGKVVVIRNPRSGRGKWNAKWPQILAKLGEPEVKQTNTSGHATDLARQAVIEGADLVIAAGGDGTVTQVANGLIGSNTTLALLPMGTGNDLGRTLGIRSVEMAIATILTNHRISMDVGFWRTDLDQGYFLNIAGMGFDAAVAERINQGFKSLKGTAAYLVAVIATLGKFRSLELKLILDGKVHHESVMLAAIANAQCYGGGMKIAPMASITDGLLDVILVKEIGKLEFLRAFPKVFKGNHLGHVAVDHLRAKHIRLEPRGTSPFLIDGELTPCKWVEIEIKPAELSIVAPTN